MLAPLLFSTFVVLVVLILMNIFLAILNDAFAVVSERQKRAQSLGGLFRNLFYKKVLRRQIESLLTEITDTAIVDGDDDLLQKFDSNGDAQLDAGELEELLRRTRLFEHFTVKELITRFDGDGDGKLSGGEVTQMNDALLRKRRQVDMQLAAQLSPRTRSKVAAIFSQHETFGGGAEASAKGGSVKGGSVKGGSVTSGGGGGSGSGGEEEGPTGAEGAPLSGMMTTDELRYAIEEMGYEITDEQLRQLMREFDADESGGMELLEFTALMARMLGYRELPSEQHKLLRKVFDYVDSDKDGEITPEELKAVVERFGMRMPASQLDMYLAEFDANGDGLINVTEFCNLMSKLHGRLGITTNPVMVAKDLQLTVRKLEQLVSGNAARTAQALDALVLEAKLDAPSAVSASLATLAAKTEAKPAAAVAAAAAGMAQVQQKACETAAVAAPVVPAAGGGGGGGGSGGGGKKHGAALLSAMLLPSDSPDDNPSLSAQAQPQQSGGGEGGGLWACIAAANQAARDSSAGASPGHESDSEGEVASHGGGGGSGGRGGSGGHGRHRSGRSRASRSPSPDERRGKSHPGRLHRHGSGTHGSGSRPGSRPDTPPIRSDPIDTDEVISLGVFPTAVAAKVALEKRQPLAEAAARRSPARGRSHSPERRGGGSGGRRGKSGSSSRSKSPGGSPGANLLMA